MIVVFYRHGRETGPFQRLLICTLVTRVRRLPICTSIRLVRLLVCTSITLLRLLICTSITLLRRLLGRLRVESHFVRRTVFQHYPSGTAEADPEGSAPFDSGR